MSDWTTRPVDHWVVRYQSKPGGRWYEYFKWFPTRAAAVEEGRKVKGMNPAIEVRVKGVRRAAAKGRV